MVEQSDNLDRIFQALADGTRRAMLARLAEGELSVSGLAAPHAMSLAAASKHIRALEKADLIKRRIVGRTHYCRLNPDTMAEAHEWLAYYEHFWSQRLDALERLFTFQDET